jgi:hypothetical protein
MGDVFRKITVRALWALEQNLNFSKLSSEELYCCAVLGSKNGLTSNDRFNFQIHVVNVNSVRESVCTLFASIVSITNIKFYVVPI